MHTNWEKYIRLLQPVGGSLSFFHAFLSCWG